MYLQVTFLFGIKNRNLIMFSPGNITLYGGYVKMCKITDFVLFLLLRKGNRELIESIPCAQSRSADLTIILMRAERDRQYASLITNIL